MRILVVTPWFPTVDAPSSGVFVQREVDALAAVHDVRVLHLDWQRSAPLPQVHRAYRLDHVALGRADPRAYVRARRVTAAAAADVDIVHTHALTGLLPWLTGRPSPRPWVHSEHWSGITAPETLGLTERTTLRALLPALARPEVVVAESERLAAAVRPHRRGPTLIVPCVVEPVDVVEPPGGETLRLVGVGGLIDRKGPLLAVDALADLVDGGTDASLTWVGEGPQRAEVLSRAAGLGVADRVALTGTLPGSGVSAALDAADVFVLPTRGDNFCVVAAEALTHGRPIVSGIDTGAVDYTDPRVGIFVVERTAAAYARAVRDVVASTSSMTAVDIAATVAGRFTPDAVRSGLEHAYRDAGA